MNWRESQTIRILYATWLLAVVVIATSYTSSFYSILTLPEYEPPVDYIEDILDIATTDKAQLITLKGSSYYADFVFAKPETTAYYLIGKHMNR